ncbi:hypothetical protein GCM10007901_41180 [Dyella acidisoli]|uniref:Uncharacterized protein n=1 Tax=Dyella acidisoli TaxID=1867834 RepID=A0ABQ5XU87_9GAMM|nr:hypothetical protein GCM10007901_41180 [Dyella acidisoli]
MCKQLEKFAAAGGFADQFIPFAAVLQYGAQADPHHFMAIRYYNPHALSRLPSFSCEWPSPLPDMAA